MNIIPKQLNESLKKGDFKRLYLVIGNDEYIVNRCVERIIKSHSDAELLRFDAGDFKRERLEEAFFAFPLLSDGRLLVIDGFKTATISSESLTLFEELFRDIPAFLTVILRNYVDGRFSISKQTEKLLSKTSSVIVSVEQQKGRNAEEFIASMAKREGSAITADAAKRLLELLGDDLMLADGEVKKLAALSGYTTISAAHVESLTVKSTESSVFDMIGALERKNLRRAIGILSEMLVNQTEPLVITASLNTAFINLYRAKIAVKNKNGESELFSLFDYKKGDRKVSIAMGREREYTEAQLVTILELLYRLDVDLKSSPVDRSLLLEQATIEIAAVRN